ncbi:hypothetical protein [Haloferula sp. BvORR071]|uniref:hypothetical protein n=1 Tax=Haloferula sp. BvORR071 TaxID=1396141 RepID=UPI002240EC7C|nr:hypothetical protein [Haloferula sp. BvORR071]
MNRTAVIVFVLGLLAFVAFHLLVVDYYVDPAIAGGAEPRGWEVWEAMWEFCKSPDLGEMPETLVLPSFVCSALLAVTSPFLVPVFRKSRPLWWLGVLVSGLVLLSLGGVTLATPVDPEISVPGPGTYCCLGALVLNFLGFLFVRREQRPELEPCHD